jgi:hypothetical protein
MQSEKACPMEIINWWNLYNTDSQNTTSTQQCYRQLDASRQKYRVDSTAQKTREGWQGKRIHGQLPCNLDEKLVDNEQSYRWLKCGDIRGETESTVVAGSCRPSN